MGKIHRINAKKNFCADDVIHLFLMHMSAMLDARPPAQHWKTGDEDREQTGRYLIFGRRRENRGGIPLESTLAGCPGPVIQCTVSIGRPASTQICCNSS
jgi:hypothetical protein